MLILLPFQGYDQSIITNHVTRASFYTKIQSVSNATPFLILKSKVLSYEVMTPFNIKLRGALIPMGI